MDAVLASVNALLLARAAPQADEDVLEIGCGAGATTLAFAERVGPAGSVLAVDISPPLLALARQRAAAYGPRVAFIEADAQTHSFEADSVDLIVSRFGIMFFEDPVAAFANMRKALRPRGRLVVAAWASADANPWFSVPRDAAIARLGPPPAASPHAPGPLAFADRDRVAGILREAGFMQPKGEAVPVVLEPGGSVADVGRLMSNIGAAARIILALNGGPEDTDAISRSIEHEIARYAVGDAVRIPATINLFTARAAH
jgi:SAM-dependent methyltransferase